MGGAGPPGAPPPRIGTAPEDRSGRATTLRRAPPSQVRTSRGAGGRDGGRAQLPPVTEFRTFQPGQAALDGGYSKRTVEGAVILRSSGSVSVMIPKATTRPMAMIV